PVLKLGDFGICPAMEALRLYPDRAHIAGRIISAQADLDSMLHHRAHGLAQSICAVWLLGARGHQFDDVLALERCSSLVTVLVTFLVRLLTEPIDDVAVDRLRARLHRTEGDRIVIANGERADRARLHALAPYQHRLTSERFLVGGHELRRPR